MTTKEWERFQMEAGFKIGRVTASILNRYNQLEIVEGGDGRYEVVVRYPKDRGSSVVARNRVGKADLNRVGIKLAQKYKVPSQNLRRVVKEVEGGESN